MVCFAYTDFSRGRICEVPVPLKPAQVFHFHLFALGTQGEFCPAGPSGCRRYFVNCGCHDRKETNQKGEYADCCSGDA